jgi:hypothetical protein
MHRKQGEEAGKQHIPPPPLLDRRCSAVAHLSLSLPSFEDTGFPQTPFPMVAANYVCHLSDPLTRGMSLPFHYTLCPLPAVYCPPSFATRHPRGEGEGGEERTLIVQTHAAAASYWRTGALY